ncbi:MAG: DDE-type integrase/transposase/recombinase [Corynebacterium glutamicum]|nr:DDE-type integrase/transposase/recombinase [Corynebacterium glutamicum]
MTAHARPRKPRYPLKGVLMATDYQAIMLALTRGDSWTTITHDFGCSRRTIDKASRTIRTHGFDTTAILSLSPDQLTELFPDNRYRKEEDFLPPNSTAIAARQRRGERVTLKVEHHRYCQQPVRPGQQHYTYKQFCKLYDHFVDVNDLTAQITHRPGDQMYVDWSGDSMTVTDPITGTRYQAWIFVASLPYSGMVFAVATPDTKMRAWLSSHQDAFDYFGGRPVKITPDNASTATNQLFQGVRVRDVNEEYFRFSQHFGVGITPARPMKPRDKAMWKKPMWKKR